MIVKNIIVIILIFSNMDNILEQVILQSFQEEQNTFNQKQINNTESKNILSIFQQVKPAIGECNICYQEEQPCIQCYQCEFKYCSTCLGKIVSEFTKCSSCSCDLKNNYQKLIQKNSSKSKLTPPPPPPRTTYNIPSSTPSSTPSRTGFHNFDINDYLPDNAFDSDSNNDNSLNEYELEQLEQLKLLNNSHNSTRQNHITKPGKPYGFTITTDDINKMQIYTSSTSSNSYSNSNLFPIIINTQNLDNSFQSILKIYLCSIIDNTSSFTNKWSQISTAINKFNNQCNGLIGQPQSNIIQNKKKDLIKKIIDIVN